MRAESHIAKFKHRAHLPLLSEKEAASSLFKIKNEANMFSFSYAPYSVLLLEDSPSGRSSHVTAHGAWGSSAVNVPGFPRMDLREKSLF